MCAYMFSSLDKTFSHIIKLGNNTSMKVMGKRAVKFTLHGVRCTIRNVYRVHELKNNLLSVGQLQEKGVAVLFKDGVCSIYHPQKGKIVESIMRENRQFILRTEPSTTTNEERCLQVSNTDQSTLWHHRWSSQLQSLVHLDVRVAQQRTHSI